MRARLSVLLVTTFVMVLTSFQVPVAFAQEQQNQQRDPNEGEPKHEINELQNRLHHTDNPSKENHLEGKIDALQDQRQDKVQFGSFSDRGMSGCGFGFVPSGDLRRCSDSGFGFGSPR